MKATFSFEELHMSDVSVVSVVSVPEQGFIALTEPTLAELLQAAIANDIVDQAEKVCDGEIRNIILARPIWKQLDALETAVFKLLDAVERAILEGCETTS
jgi:hypothetical protein